MVGASSTKEIFDPVGIVGSDSRTTNFKTGTSSSVGNGSGGLNIEGGIIRILAKFPTTEKIWFVPNFVIDTGNFFVN